MSVCVKPKFNIGGEPPEPVLWTFANTTSDIWCDFADEPTIQHNFGSIYRIDDKSGNNNNLIQNAATSQPLTGINQVNGLNVISFDGSDDYMESPIFTGDVYTSYFVLDTSTGASRNAIWCEEPAASSTKNYLFTLGGNITYDQFPPSGGAATGIAPEGIHLVEVVQTASNFREIYVDGTLLASSTEEYSGFPVVTASLGGRINSNNWFDTDMCEMNILLAVRSLDDREKAQGSLCWKWGIESLLPALHPYKSAPPEV